MKSIKSLFLATVLIFICIGIKTQLSAMKRPAEDSSDTNKRQKTYKMVTIKTSDGKEVPIPLSIADKIPAIQAVASYESRMDIAEKIPLKLSSIVLEPIIAIIKQVEVNPSFKRKKDNTYIAQKIQPTIDSILSNQSLEIINGIILASDFLGLDYITNGAIRVWVQKELQENPEITREQITENKREDLKPLYDTQYVLIKAGNIPELSIADYIALNGMPAITTGYDFQGNPIAKLDLSHKRLTSLEGLDQIDHIATVQWLYLSNNQLSSLPVGIFNGLRALRELRLNYNQIVSLPPGIFTGLTKLRTLFLSNNQLSSLLAGIFNGLIALQRLHLDNNQLQTLPAGIFNGLIALQALYLSFNQLSSLPAGIFNGLIALRWLFLANNQLSSLPAGIFNELTALQVLYLSSNQLNITPAQIRAANPKLPQNITIAI